MLPDEILTQVQTLIEYAGFNPDEVLISSEVLKELKQVEQKLLSVIEKIKSSEYYSGKK